MTISWYLIPSGLLGMFLVFKFAKGRMDDWLDHHELRAITVILTFAAFLGITLWGAVTIPIFLVGQQSCRDLGQDAGLSTEYHGLLQGCFVNFDGQWIPQGRWIQIRQSS